jgi:hypothetical protein
MADIVPFPPATPPGFAPWLLSQLDMRIGGDEAWSYVPDGWPHACAVIVTSGFSGEQWHVFPSFEEAAIAARMAIVPDIGGYSDVRVVDAAQAPADAEIHESAIQWLL